MQPAAAEEPHPLSIEGMRRQEYPARELTVESMVHDNAYYTSEEVQFTADGIRQYALISTPKGQVPDNGFPVILLLHGYIPPSNYSTLRSYPVVFDRYARSEFMVVKPDYRGHGRSQINEDFQRELSAVYYTEDILYLLGALSVRENADMDNIFLMGHSLGGEVALRLLVSYSGIRGASLWAPMTVRREEANFFYSGGGKRRLGDGALSSGDTGLEQALQDLDAALSGAGLKERSAVRYLDSLDAIQTPMLIRHPDTDESVPYAWSQQFLNRYKRSGNSISLKLINYPGENHNISRSQAQAQSDDLQWFRSLAGN